jgi:hypothetical protein
LNKKNGGFFEKPPFFYIYIMEKICIKCEYIKDISLFIKNRNICKICMKEYKRNYHINNKESISEKKKKYYLENSDSIKNRMKENYENNKDSKI